ncbi:MAG: polyhydroxyalkanoic acid system family protein [Burkholderiaceae bacterium]
MADIRIHRKHRLGLTRARELAAQWAEQAERQFGLQCTLIEGKTADTVEFQRPGATGRLTVGADHVDVNAQLGFLLGAFGASIEAEIEKTLDALLAKSDKPARAAAAKKAGVKKAARR